MITFSWFFLLSNLETVINLGDLCFSKFSTLPKVFLFNSSTRSTPGLMTTILSSLTPNLMAKFLVYSELATMVSTLSKTSNTLY